MALHPNDRMRLKDLMNILRSGELPNPVSSRPTYPSKNSSEMRPATHSITHVSNIDHDLQNLHLAQQQLLQPIVNQSYQRRTIPVSQR